MLNPVGRAGAAIVSPLWKANDPAAAEMNWNQLVLLFGSVRRFPGAITIQFPAGVFYVGKSGNPLFSLDELAAGTTIQGMGAGKTVLITPTGVTEPLRLLSSRVDYFSTGTVSTTVNEITGVTDINSYSKDDVIYIWTENSGNGRSTSYRRVIFSVDTGGQKLIYSGTVPSVASPVRFKHVKGIALLSNIPAKSNTVRLSDSTLASRLRVGDDVLIGDGPALNNFYGEWAKIASINEESSPVVVTLDRRLRRDYAVASGFEACIVPGPHMSDITIRNLSIAMPTGSGADNVGTVRFGLRVQLEGVDFIGRPSSSPTYLPLNLVNCGGTSVGGSAGTAILKQWATQDTQVVGSELAAVDCREYAMDLIFDGISTYRPEGFQCASTSGPGPCERIHLLNSRITNHGNGSSAANVNFVKDSVISNVQIVQPNHSGTPPTISLEDDRLTLTNVTSGSAISVSGDDLRIENLTSANGLTLVSGSSGILLTPLLPASASLSDYTNSAWRTPLLMRTDRKVVSTSTTAPTLQVMALSMQTADLQQWQNSSGGQLFSIRSDGYIATSKIEASAVPTSQSHRLLIYDENDNAVGYVPIYSDPT